MRHITIQVLTCPAFLLAGWGATAATFAHAKTAPPSSAAPIELRLTAAQASYREFDTPIARAPDVVDFKALTNLRKKTIATGLEWGISFFRDADGKLEATEPHSSGNSGRILARTDGADNKPLNLVFTAHSHPSDRSFSMNDLIAASVYKRNEIVVTERDIDFAFPSADTPKNAGYIFGTAALATTSLQDTLFCDSIARDLAYQRTLVEDYTLSLAFVLKMAVMRYDAKSSLLVRRQPGNYALFLSWEEGFRSTLTDALRIALGKRGRDGVLNAMISGDVEAMLRPGIGLDRKAYLSSLSRETLLRPGAAFEWYGSAKYGEPHVIIQPATDSDKRCTGAANVLFMRGDGTKEATYQVTDVGGVFRVAPF